MAAGGQAFGSGKVQLWDVKVKNTGDKARNLSLFSYLEFSFHHIMIDNQNYQMSLYCAGASYEDGIIEEDLFYEEEGYQYFTADFAPDGFDCMRDKFLGTYNTETNPAAVIAGQCFSSYEKGGNHCGSLQKNVTLQPGEEVRFIFMLGEGRRDEGRRIRAKYADHGAVDAAREELKNFWEEKCSKLQVQTPNDGMNALLNTWTLYQSEINVMFSRFASFIEVGGRVGLGYRDTAQDAMTIPHSNPGKCRERIEQLLRGLTSAGYGLHLFQPEWFMEDTGVKPFKSPTVIPEPDKDSIIHGLKDACSDDALWLVAAVTEYIKETGDRRQGFCFFAAALCGHVSGRKKGDGVGLWASETDSGLLHGAGGADRNLQGASRRLERLSQSGRRRERHGKFPALLGVDAVRRSRQALGQG